MPLYSFTIVIDGVDLDEDAADAIYGGGLDDATIRRFAGWQLVEVDRQAGSYRQALFSALGQLREAVRGLQIVRVEPDGFLALQDIADRTGRSRESIRLLIIGERGPGGFPPPIVRHAGRSRLWSVRDVAYWFAEHLGETTMLDELTREVVTLNAAVNARLDLQRVANELDAEDRRALADLVPLEEAG
jgi:hypothetical protein